MRSELSVLSVIGANVVALGLLASEASAGSYTNDFSSPVPLANSQAPGVWYPDRYAPSGFQSIGNVLVQDIAGADQQSLPFYNTQGRKYDVRLGHSPEVSIDLFVPSSYNQSPASNANWRSAGLWAGSDNAAGELVAYPVIAFRNNTANPAGFYVTFDGANYAATGATVNYDAFNTLSFKLNPGVGFEYFVNGSSVGTMPVTDAVLIREVILQGGNYGSDYSITWDNLSAIPEPASLGVMALAGVALMRRRRALAR